MTVTPEGLTVTPFPEGTRLLHIGPPKTGTTSLQAAFWAARDEALAQGVRYAGTGRHSTRAVLAVTGRRTLDRQHAVPPISHWETLLREITGAEEARVVLSSEGFSYAQPDKIERVVRDLDPIAGAGGGDPPPGHEAPRIGVAAARAERDARVPSRTGSTPCSTSQITALPEGSGTGSDTIELIERWAAPIGLDRVTAVIVDEADHGRLYRVFEDLTGLRPGTIVPVDARANRSLTLAEIRAMEALEDRLEAEGIDMVAFRDITRMKVATHMKARRPGPGEARIEAPQWALDRAGEIAREIVAGIETTRGPRDRRPVLADRRSPRAPGRPAATCIRVA